MHDPSLTAMIARRKRQLGQGPIALILAEDSVELSSTLAHHANAGFAHIIVCCARALVFPQDVPDQVIRVDCNVFADGALQTLVNTLIKAVPGQWIYHGYNAEYLFTPFCESRHVHEVLEYVATERRDAVMCTVVDLYAQDLMAHPDAVDHDTACFDRAGYYAFQRRDGNGNPLDRQMDIHGGLRWRYADHIDRPAQRLNRVALFRARPGLRMLPDKTFNIAAYNTIAAPWHHSLTAAVASFRTAKALCRNPGSRAAIDSFNWPQSTRFTWQSQQLLDLGLMEPGQWF